MIRRAQAVRYDRKAESGRTQPLRIAADTTDLQRYDTFLKASASPGGDLEGLVNEALGACFGAALGLPVCEPLLVELTPEFIASVQDDAVRQMLAQSNQLAFGSISAGDGWRSWLRTDNLRRDQFAIALAILAFDAFAPNPDRRADNPNLLVKGTQIRVIDHELAFRIRMLIPRPRPWMEGSLNWLESDDGHALLASLKGRRNLDFDAVRDSWSALSDDVLEGCAAAIPQEWGDATVAVADALTHVGSVRDNVEGCIVELRRVLQ